MLSYWIGRIALNFAQDEKALHGSDIGQVGKFGPVKMLVLVHVVGSDPKKKVEGSGHLKTLHDLGEFNDFALEVGKGSGSVIIDGRTCGSKAINPFGFFGIQNGDDPADIAFLFESPGTLVDGGDGFMELKRDFFMGGGAVCLKQA